MVKMKMNKKTWILFNIIALVLLGCGCSQTSSEVPSTTGVITLDSNIEIPSESCIERGLSDKIIMLESKYCGHCKIAEPILKEIGQEKGLNLEFLDVSKKEDMAVMESYGINIKYTPTLIAGCFVYIGSKSKEEYAQIIDKFIEGT
jgi:thiol-disulfide isomerase/thioredoxin